MVLKYSRRDHFHYLIASHIWSPWLICKIIKLFALLTPLSSANIPMSVCVNNNRCLMMIIARSWMLLINHFPLSVNQVHVLLNYQLHLYFYFKSDARKQLQMLEVSVIWNLKYLTNSLRIHVCSSWVHWPY
jgi:hypothetical protein